jgi:hypothetical protein
MADDQNTPVERVEYREYRSLLTDAAIVLTPPAILAQPIVGAWANQHFSEKQEEPPPPPQEQPPKD